MGMSCYAEVKASVCGSLCSSYGSLSSVKLCKCIKWEFNKVQVLYLNFWDSLNADRHSIVHNCFTALFSPAIRKGIALLVDKVFFGAEHASFLPG